MAKAQGPITDKAGARTIAFRVLAIREHSCSELKEKLLRRSVSEAVAEQTVSALETEGLLSDERFAAAFTRSRVTRNQGPLRIRAELLKRGVSGTLVDQALAGHEDDWTEMAFSWVRKRSGASLDRNEKARLYRSGTRRGFTHEQMMQALSSLEGRD